MKLSTRSTYGLRALVELGLAFGRGPLSAALIATRQELSVAYLEQLLHRLKKQGLVTSIRGPRGGYLLARDPQQITVADIVRVLDGLTMEQNGKVVAEGQPLARHIAQAVFHCVHDRLMQSLDQVSLRDLCDEVRELAGESLEHRYVFHI